MSPGNMCLEVEVTPAETARDSLQLHDKNGKQVALKTDRYQ